MRTSPDPYRVIEHQGRLCRKCAKEHTIIRTYDITPYPRIVFCPRCDRKDEEEK